MKPPENSYIKNYLACIAVINAIEKNQEHIKTAIESQPHSEQHNMLRAITTGLLRNYESVSHWVKEHTRFKPKDQCLRQLIMVGAFQYQYMDSGNKSQIAYQAAEATTHLNRAWAKPIVYAVLNKLKHSPIQPAANAPKWLLEKLASAYHPQTVTSILQQWQSLPDTLCIRVNPQHTRDAVEKLLHAQNITTEKSTISPIGLYIPQAGLAEALRLPEGAIYLQDSIHQSSPRNIPKLAPGARVLDACAAPGGKTTALLCQQPDIHIDALEINEQRVVRLKENLIGWPQATIIVGDAMQPEKWWNKQPYDAIIVDAPCSATGLIQRKPDVKLIQSPENIRQLTQEQKKLLRSLWPLLKKDGTLLYSTCSILPEENDEVVLDFAKRDDATIMQNQDKTPRMHTSLPTSRHTGGFFALLQKTQ